MKVMEQYFKGHKGSADLKKGIGVFILIVAGLFLYVEWDNTFQSETDDNTTARGLLKLTGILFLLILVAIAARSA